MSLGTDGILGRAGSSMIDNFSLALTHGLMILAVWRLLRRPDLDEEQPTPDAVRPESAAPRRWGRKDA